MNSTSVLLDNLKRHYNIDSMRMIAKKLGYSSSVILNWSSGRSSPNIKHLNEIAYNLGVEVCELLIEDNLFTVKTNIWRDRIEMTLVANLGSFRLECDIREKFFKEDIGNKYKMSYRSFLRYVNGKNKRVNLVILDRLAKIFNTEPYKLLKEERRI